MQALRWPKERRCWILAAILIVASALRMAHLGRLSFWYDEVVPMELARQRDPASLLRLLFQIEATRAPLHPLVLHYWVELFGPSEFSARALSALCGVATVGLVYWLGRRLYDPPTALWASALCAISPLLVRYSQEAKMYAWLVMVTSLSWAALVALMRSAHWGRIVLFGLSQVALAYSQPLGLLIIAAQALAFLLNRSAFQLNVMRWVIVELVVAVAILPWVGNYLDHPPESVTGPLPIKYLIALPIGFTGGNRLTLLAAFALIVWGLLGKASSRQLENDRSAPPPAPPQERLLDRPEAFSLLGCWLVLPPVLLYVYSRFGHPIFGPPRYTLFVGPAYLLLLARGLVKLPGWLRLAAALGIGLLCGSMLGQEVYAPDLKADWRAVAWRVAPRHPGATFVVLTGDRQHNVEVETARYYLGFKARVVPLQEALVHPPSGEVLFAVGLKHGVPVAEVPEELRRRYEIEEVLVFPGLRIERAVSRKQERDPNSTPWSFPTEGGGCRLITSLLAVTPSGTRLEVRSLPSTGVTRLPRYYEPLRLPPQPGRLLRASRWSVQFQPPRRVSRVA